MIDAVPDLKSFLENVESTRYIAEEAIRKAIVRYTQYANKKVTHDDFDVRFEPGNTVFVKAKHIIMPGFKGRESSKLQPKSVGPFDIIKRVGGTGVELDMPGYAHCKQFHVNSLIPYQEELDFRAHLRTGDQDLPSKAGIFIRLFCTRYKHRHAAPIPYAPD